MPLKCCSYMRILVPKAGISGMGKLLYTTVYCGIQLLIQVWYICFWHQSPHIWITMGMMNFIIIWLDGRVVAVSCLSVLQRAIPEFWYLVTSGYELPICIYVLLMLFDMCIGSMPLNYHYNDVTGALWRLKSPVTLSFGQQYVGASSKGNIKVLHCRDISILHYFEIISHRARAKWLLGKESNGY